MTETFGVADLRKAIREQVPAVTEKVAGQMLEAFFYGVMHAMNEGKTVRTGLGTFKIVERAARTGRNPNTGEALEIPAQKTVKFTPSKWLKDNIQ